MKVIFLHDVPRVGRKNDVKEINSGYAMNFLLPRKLAITATPEAIKALELRKKEVLIEREIQEDLLQKNLEEIKGKVVVMKAKADDKGHLFSGIHAKEIAGRLYKDHGAVVSEEFIVLDKPIKALGEHEIVVKVKDKETSFKLRVENV